jgi:hypothetical protein
MLNQITTVLAQEAPPQAWWMAYVPWALAGLIVVAVLVYGLGDLLRLNSKRIWAISSVGFRESIRRRVLWITPLAMLGIVAVTQLSHPVDAQDTIRQATKYCLFATGIVVVIATLILACTSLPKEIDNRVIYTIVTKPTTRLEIVLGKVVGFARTSLVILLIMGLFSYAYLQFNAGQLRAAAQSQLRTLPAADPSRDTLQHYADEGLLHSRTYARPTGLAMFARVPDPSDKYAWVFGAGEQNVVYTFDLPAEVFTHEDTFLMFNVRVAARQPRPLSRREIEQEAPDPTATTRATTQGVQRLPGKPRIEARLLNKEGFTAASANLMMDVMHQSEVQSKDPNVFKDAGSVVLEPVAGSRAGEGTAIIAVPPQSVFGKLKELPEDSNGRRRVSIMITGLTPATWYGFANDSVTLTSEVMTSKGQQMTLTVPRASDDGRDLPVGFRGRLSTTHNQQLRGDADPNEAPVAIFQFRGSGLATAADTVPFEFRTKVERSGAEVGEAENVTNVELVIRNRKSNFVAPPILIKPDSDRPTFFRAPAAAVAGGDFDVQVRSRTEGHYVGLRTGSLAVVASTQSFATNLVKSLLILWLLSVLVVVIAIFCSTFVSWPIAVVLTLVLLLGRWCVVQLGEPSSAQQIWNEFFPRAGSVETRVFTDTFSVLNWLLRFVAGLLPDLDQFRVTEDIERGVTIPFKGLLDPLRVLATFGLPVLLLAYLFLRKKEVAP